jgi:transposase-like protein
MAKERWEAILETVAGKLTISEACARLGIEEAMFYRLRTQALQAGLSRLEPRSPGRPAGSSSAESRRIAQLERALEEKELEVKAAQVRVEIAQAMPQVVQDEGLKKTSGGRRGHRRLQRPQRRRRKKPSR